MSVRFAYFYFMTDDPRRVQSVAPQHAAHWRGLNLLDYSGGPFADRTGGLITFVADELTSAEAAVAADPFVRQNLLECSWLKQWDLVERAAAGSRELDNRAGEGTGE